MPLIETDQDKNYILNFKERNPNATKEQAIEALRTVKREMGETRFVEQRQKRGIPQAEIELELGRTKARNEAAKRGDQEALGALDTGEMQRAEQAAGTKEKERLLQENKLGGTIGAQVVTSPIRAAAAVPEAMQEANKRAEDIRRLQSTGEIGLGEAMLQQFGVGFTGSTTPITRAAGEIAKPVVEPLVEAAAPLVPKEVKDFFGNIQKGIAEMPEKDRIRIQNALGVLEGFTGVAGLIGGGSIATKALQTGAGEAAAAGTAEAAAGLSKAAGTGVEIATRQGLGEAAQGIAKTAKSLGQKKLNQLEELISPKITAAETKNIIKQGRGSRTPESTLFGKKPDLIETPDIIKRGAQVLSERVDGIKKLIAKKDDIGIFNAAKAEGAKIAQELRPEMKALSLRPETIKNMAANWVKTKKAQLDSIDFAAAPSVGKKVQQKFELVLDDLSKPVKDELGKFRTKTLDDAWNRAIEYDNLFDKSVKAATSTSPVSKQLQKTLWLESRDILRGILKDEAKGLGETAKKAFRDMTDLHAVQESLLGKIKLDVKGKPNILGEMTKTKNLIKAGATAAGIKFLTD